jgi:hypothetical protein
MRLYYTTPAGFDQEQKNSNLSLGGFKSSTPMPNGVFNNLFGDITQNTIAKTEEFEHIGLVLENTNISQSYNTTMWFEYPENSYVTYEVAAVQLTNWEMEHISSTYETPLYATFFEAKVGSRVALGDIGSGTGIGVWVRRKLNLAFIKDDQDNLYTDDPANVNRFLPVELGKSDEIKVHFSWD